jgi:amylosucrase
MMMPFSIKQESIRSLNRLLPRLKDKFYSSIKSDPKGWQKFESRLTSHFLKLFRLYYDIYGNRYDFFFHLEDLLKNLADAWFQRPDDLRKLDQYRESDPLWFQSNKMLGGVIYVDLFADDLEGVRSKIPYFKELGLTYLHLMPFFKRPVEKNDGGYAVSSYREIQPPLGTMEQLALLAKDLRAAGISLVADLVFNHTSDEHIWAERAKQGDVDYKEMYLLFPDRTIPDTYELNLREIFPEEHPGAFTLVQITNDQEQKEEWVWTTFHSYQWDLNYANPIVFNHMAEEMLFLANKGVEVIRLDAVAFIWKKLGTSCENLPEAHKLIQAFNSVARIVAPSLLFKSEAIVHPDNVASYISLGECQLSYNPLVMALLWNSLATRETRLLSQALSNRFNLDPGTAWVNYVRCHDDIGWTFSDEDAAQLGINGYDHRHFLNDFYRGRFPGSFARGLPFQENPKTGDCRISGTCASLAGLEKALAEEGPDEVELAIRRITLLHGIIMTIGGIPLIYLGDEIGTCNDYSYREHPRHMNDSRWVHRPKSDWVAYERRNDPESIEGRIYNNFKALVSLRKRNRIFSNGSFEVIETENPHVLGYARQDENTRVIVFANFSEGEQTVINKILLQQNISGKKRIYGFSQIPLKGDLTIRPLDFLVIER